MKHMEQKMKRLQEDMERARLISGWRSRLTALHEHNGMDVKTFCARHGFDDSHLNHQMAGRRGAKQAHVDAVEAALKAEELDAGLYVEKPVENQQENAGD